MRRRKAKVLVDFLRSAFWGVSLVLLLILLGCLSTSHAPDEAFPGASSPSLFTLLFPLLEEYFNSQFFSPVCILCCRCVHSIAFFSHRSNSADFRADTLEPEELTKTLCRQRNQRRTKKDALSPEKSVTRPKDTEKN